jgi:hypothetical protein
MPRIGLMVMAGRRMYDPAMMGRFSTGVRSSRAIERHCREHVAFRVISGNLIPDPVTITRFICRHGQALAVKRSGVACKDEQSLRLHRVDDEAILGRRGPPKQLVHDNPLETANEVSGAIGDSAATAEVLVVDRGLVRRSARPVLEALLQDEEQQSDCHEDDRERVAESDGRACEDEYGRRHAQAEVGQRDGS